MQETLSAHEANEAMFKGYAVAHKSFPEGKYLYRPGPLDNILNESDENQEDDFRLLKHTTWSYGWVILPKTSKSYR